MKLNSFQSIFFAAALLTNVFLLLYLVTLGEQQQFYHYSHRSSKDINFLGRKIVKIEDMVIKNERRMFESLSELEKQLKSSAKRYRRRNDDNENNLVKNNSTERVEEITDTFENTDLVILEQARRRQRIKEVCRMYRNGSSSEFNEENFYEATTINFSQTILPQSFLIDELKTRSAFCYNFKAAASTWMRVYAQLYPDESFWQEVKDNQQFYKVMYKMSARSIQNVHQVFDSGDFFTFMVVRHPLDRVLSAYRDRILNGCTSQSRQTVPTLFVQLGDSRVWLGTSVLFDRITGCIKIYPTFLEFARFLILRPDLHDEHWMTYGKHCAPCLVEYDSIIKLETASRDEPFVMNRSKIGKFVQLELKNPTQGGKTEEKRREFYSTIPCQILEQLISVYKMDFEMFDYDVTPFRNICDKGNETGNLS